ncbi:hypothetical protein [Heyndrickxia sporothermodurans]|uniref:Uncharacterized protein n=1 Tax=Heyndrickxia sporothermodurans TaxID=46224 RepID=A0AB37HHL9_9BACI|nr:hypothetical protein JGZ69_04185 [Heyndrickxia sporothermodurans]
MFAGKIILCPEGAKELLEELKKTIYIQLKDPFHFVERGLLVIH